MTTRPRMMVAMGQPLTSMPSNGVQPQRLAMSSWREGAARLQVDDGQVGVVALGHAALAGDAEHAAARRALVRSTKRSSVSRPSATWVSITGTRVCTPGMPDGEAG